LVDEEDQFTMAFNQYLNYNIVMLACQYGSYKILEYLYEKVVVTSKNPAQTKKDLLFKCGNNIGAKNGV
jgi:hypothetical protein